MNVSSWTSLIVSLVALIVAWDNRRRSHDVVVRRLKVQGASAQSSENGGQMFSYFFIDIRNLGVPLHDVNVTVVFTKKNREGEFRLGLARYDMQGVKRMQSGAEFLKGMVARFGAKSFEHVKDGKYLTDVQLLPSNSVKIVVTSQGYEVAEWPVDSLGQRMKRRWNKISYRVNGWFDRHYTDSNGQPRYRPGEILPRFNTLRHSLAYFTETLQRDIEAYLQGVEASAKIPPCPSNSPQP